MLNAAPGRPQLLQTPLRIAVVLAGGGARGAYEAGVLLAFQDAGLPTHIIAAASVGSINAASYAAHSSSLVGNAESLVRSWSQVTPPAMGIDWSRYIFMLGGLIAASAGFGNLLHDLLTSGGIFLTLDDPKLTWMSLGLAGALVLFFFDQIPYIYYVLAKLIRKSHWSPDRRKALRSALVNFVVVCFLYIFLNFTHFHLWPGQAFELELSGKVMLLAMVPLGMALWWLMRGRLSLWSHRFLRLPLRSGLFPNFERAKFLRSHIPAAGLHASPIRVVMTATDIRTGSVRFFTNASPQQLLRDPQVTRSFIEHELEQAPDLLQTVVASSAFPIAYEAVPMRGRVWIDGGIVANQPIRPAVRLGADILFLVDVHPRETRSADADVKTFLDVGVQAITMLMSHNLATDMKLLGHINRLCENYSARVGLRAEQVELEVGAMRYRYVKAFPIAPPAPLPASTLDFDGPRMMPLIAQGYNDGGHAVLEFLEYLAALPERGPRRMLKLVPEAVSEQRAQV